MRSPPCSLPGEADWEGGRRAGELGGGWAGALEWQQGAAGRWWEVMYSQEVRNALAPGPWPAPGCVCGVLMASSEGMHGGEGRSCEELPKDHRVPEAKGGGG